MESSTVERDLARARQGRRRAIRRAVRRAVYLIAGAAAAAAIVIAWMPRPIPVETAPVSRGMLRVTVDEDGQARVRDRYVVSAPLAGSLGRIALDPGDPVTRGEVVARIAPTVSALLDPRARATAEARLAQTLAAAKQARAQVERAEAAYDESAAESARQEKLYRAGAGTRQAFEQAQLGERRAAHELEAQRFATRVSDYEVEMARAALARLPGGRGGGQLDVPSPIDGRVLKVQHKSEGVVPAGAQLLEVGDPAALEVVVDILTSDAPRVRAGAPVLLDRWGGPPLPARVRRVEPSAFTRVSALGVEEQRVNVVVDLAGPRGEQAGLGDGWRVEAHIVVWEGEAVKVPASALFRRDGGWALFRVDGGRARLTAVEIGERTAREAEVVRGVSVGQRVIVNPSDRVVDGARVSR